MVQETYIPTVIVLKCLLIFAALDLGCCSWTFSHCGGFSCCAQALGSRASGAVAQALSFSVAFGIFPDQGSNPVVPALADGSLSPVPQGKALDDFLNFN